MKVAPKSVTALFFFVATIYVMRNGDQSFLSPLTKSSFRNLAYDYARKASSTCDGVSLTASFSSADMDRVKNLQNSLEKNRGGNPFRTMLEKGSVTNSAFVDYIMGLIPSIAVWAAFCVISIILCCCGVCNWCCMFGCCKNCKCCRCCKAPEGTKRKRIYLVVSLIFMVGLFSAGIAGAVYSGNVAKGMKLAFCNVLNFVEDFAYGVQGANWLGLKGVAYGLGDLSGKITDIGTNIVSIAVPDSTTYNNLDGALDTLIGQNTYQLNRVDPKVKNTKYTPTWFSNLGPKSDPSKWVGMVSAEVKSKYDGLTNAINKMNPAISDIKSTIGDIQSAVDSGQSTANSIFNSLDDAIGSLNGSGKTLNDAVTAVSKAIMGIFIAYIIIALLPIASILLIVFLKIKFFSKILHLSWCLMGILAILGFLVSAVFYPISVVFVETCGVLTASMSDSDFFQKTLANGLKSISTDASDLSYICMFGDGDALKQFNLVEKVKLFDTVYTQLDAIDTIQDLTPDGGNTRIPTVSLPRVTIALNALTDGATVDHPDITTDLNTLNTYANIATKSCATGVQDTWVLNHGACPSSGTTNFASNSAANFNLGSSTCIGVDYFGGQSYTGSQRYTTGADQWNACGTEPEDGGTSVGTTKYVQDFVDAFTAHRIALNNQVTALKGAGGAYKNVLDTNDAFELNLIQPIKDIATVKSSVSAAKDSFTNPTDGIIYNTNCKFVGNDLRNFTAALCYGFIFSLFQSVVVLIVVSMFSFVGSICVFCLAKRILNEDGVGVTKFG